MDGWMDGFSVAGGGSLGPRREAPAAQGSNQQCLFSFSFEGQQHSHTELECTRLRLAGNFKQPPPPGLP